MMGTIREPRQLGLFSPRGRDLEAQFWAFHHANPDVYEDLRTLALGLRRRGVRRYSISGLFEVLRWNRQMQTTDASSEFMLNNSYRSFFARLLMEREPELEDFFELRTLRWQTYEAN